MKLLPVIALLVLLSLDVAGKKAMPATPLSEFSDKWNDPKYQVCNTAKNATYLSASEKEIIFVLNLARMNPQLFCKSVVQHSNKVSAFLDTAMNPHYTSLVADLTHLSPKPLLFPDSLCYVSALCQATVGLQGGHTGLGRQTPDCKEIDCKSCVECRQYSYNQPLQIVLAMLFDQDVEHYGNRALCLGDYALAGPAMAANKEYKFVTVLHMKHTVKR